MTPAQLRRRETLIARSDAALERWPGRAQPEFATEMGTVAAALEALAQAMAGDRDTVELSRTWRWAGNAYFDLAAGKERHALEQAAQAYQHAEEALANATDAQEQVKLNYCFGKTLLQLCDGKDLGLATQARARLQTALGLARVHMPDGVDSVQADLATAESIVTLLGAVKGLDHRIDGLKGELRHSDARDRAAEAGDMNALFDVLKQQFEKEKPSLEPTRSAGLENVMQSFEQVVRSGTREGNSLEEMLANRGRLEALKRQLEPQVKRPSLKGAGAPAGSNSERLLAALQELKGFVGAAGMAPGAATGMREVAMDLFVRIARLTTWISQAGDDKAKVHQLENDQARALAHEVRLYATRQHVMLAQPAWPHVEASVDPNRVFFSGSARMHAELTAALHLAGLEVAQAAPTGADFATRRWQDLSTANLAVFDLSDAAAQVYYELGIALAVGAQLLLIAAGDTEIPFDIAQNVSRYPPGTALRAWLTDEVQAAIYGLQFSAGKEASLASTRTYAEQLAAAEADNAMLGVALKTLRGAGEDPIRFGEALANFNTQLGPREREILQPRWPAQYPDPRTPRNFAVMPFRVEREGAYAVVAASAKRAGVEPVRGDEAEGQEIIESIWQEICCATHVTVDLSGFNLNVCLELGIADTIGRRTLLIGEQGTERHLKDALPGVAKRRCLTYSSDPKGSPQFATGLQKFFAER